MSAATSTNPPDPGFAASHQLQEQIPGAAGPLCRGSEGSGTMRQWPKLVVSYRRSMYRIPRLSKEGWRAAPRWFIKVRFADIYKDASRLYQPPRRFAPPRL